MKLIVFLVFILTSLPTFAESLSNSDCTIIGGVSYCVSTNNPCPPPNFKIWIGIYSRCETPTNTGTGTVLDPRQCAPGYNAISIPNYTTCSTYPCWESLPHYRCESATCNLICPDGVAVHVCDDQGRQLPNILDACWDHQPRPTYTPKPTASATPTVTPEPQILYPEKIVKFGLQRGNAVYFDKNSDHVINSSDTQFVFGNATDKMFVGDWNHLGRKSIGAWRAGKFYLDFNGNNKWDSTTDKVYAFGNETDVPVVGDWTGSGYTHIGVKRGDTFYLDLNGNGKWDGPAIDLQFRFGNAVDLPVSGDWNGDGKDKIGVFRSGTFFLDLNGNRVWDYQDTTFAFGNADATPIAGDWNGNGKAKVGVFRNGVWYLDNNGNQKWDTVNSGDVQFTFGTTTDKPLVGNW